MKRQLHITGSRHPRPAAERVAYCDGSLDPAWRDAQDIELSHWIPNRTPAAYKASTSTGICLRFARDGDLSGVDLVVNNHVDSDGMLSAFVLLHPAQALAHADTLVQAAGMGDFHGWGEAEAQHLYQLMALQRVALQAEGTDPLDIYLRVHEQVARALDGERFGPAAPGLAALQRARGELDAGTIARSLLAPRLVHYVLPTPCACDDDWLPRLDMPLAPSMQLPPQARARLDAERLQLVSAPQGRGWSHALCWPGYSWAETVGLWRPPGLLDGAGSNRHRLQHPPLQRACARLNDRETAPGRWCLAHHLGPFEALPGRPFPVVMSFAQGDRPAPSALAPGVVAEVLTQALAEALSDTLGPA